ncbi:cellulose biosynthesis cyclic di-GMP-binding regulatory protein BcsB [Palleronia abyssalis]|nr:cellulose biosynthesis cyclic di-GMP-binding regulatory protein BcsB [Palleronia abyssalis]
MMKIFPALCAVAMAVAVQAPAHAQEGDAPLILIPSFTAPAASAPDGAEPAANPEFSADEISQQRTRIEPRAAEKARLTMPELAPLLSHRAGANPGPSIRMQGENPKTSFSIYLPHEAVPGQLRVAHVSGVDVLPERSVMEVTLNGEIVGQQELGNFDPDEATLFEVPAGLWQSGRNDVVIRLEQVHRLFCGPEAAFDLWTDIDLTSSGAVLAAKPLVPGAIDFLAGIAHDAGIGLPVALQDPEGLAPAAQPVLDEMAKRMTEVLRGRVLSYVATDPYGVSDSQSDLRMSRVTLVPTYGPATAEFRRGGDGALVLVLAIPPEGIPASEAGPFLDTVLRDILSERFTFDAETVQTGIDPRTRMQAGVPVTLDSLGMPTTRTTSHYFRRDQIFTLPRDWLVLTAQKATLHLDYIYARNLPEKSELLIRVNGETVRLLPLRGEGGELIEQFPIKFYANLLREGPNLLQFEALIPGDPEDEPCPPGQFPKLEIRGTSTLTVPPSPRLRLSGLRLPVYALRSGAISLDGAGMDQLPPADRLTLVATLGEPIPNASHLTAYSFDNLAALPMGAYDIDRGDIAGVLTRQPDIPEPGPAPQDRIGELPVDLFGPIEREPLDDGRGPLLRAADSLLTGLFDTNTNQVGARVETVSAKLLPDVDANAERWLAEQRGLAVLTHLDPSDPRGIELVLGPDTRLTEVAAAISAARQTIGGPFGQISVLGHDGVWRSWADAGRVPMLMEPLTLGNFRQVLGNYASWSPVTFTAIIFGFALIAALIALRLVVITRQET